MSDLLQSEMHKLSIREPIRERSFFFFLIYCIYQFDRKLFLRTYSPCFTEYMDPGFFSGRNLSYVTGKLLLCCILSYSTGTTQILKMRLASHYRSRAAYPCRKNKNPLPPCPPIERRLKLGHGSIWCTDVASLLSFHSIQLLEPTPLVLRYTDS